MGFDTAGRGATCVDAWICDAFDFGDGSADAAGVQWEARAGVSVAGGVDVCVGEFSGGAAGGAAVFWGRGLGAGRACLVRRLGVVRGAGVGGEFDGDVSGEGSCVTQVTDGLLKCE